MPGAEGLWLAVVVQAVESPFILDLSEIDPKTLGRGLSIEAEVLGLPKHHRVKRDRSPLERIRSRK